MSTFLAQCQKLGFVRGAVVEITQFPHDCAYSDGWENEADEDMELEVGNKFVISDVDDNGITGEYADDDDDIEGGVEGTNFAWPWWCLKLVKASTNKNADFGVGFAGFLLGERVVVGEDVGRILGFDYENDLIHVDLGDSAYTYWFNYFDVGKRIPRQKVELNDNYTAVIDMLNETVSVDCQTFTFKKVLELANAIKQHK